MHIITFKKILSAALATLLVSWSLAGAALEVGDKAPDFKLQASDGKTYQLGNGVTITPDPNEVNYRRTVMHTRVSLRNMKLVIRGGV